MSDKWKRRWLYIIAIAVFIIVIAAAAALSVWTANIKRLIANNKPVTTTVTQIYEGKDGKTPIKGLDYFDGLTPKCYFSPNQCQGADGLNSISTNTIEKITVLKELPPEKGDKGDTGQPAPKQEIYVDYETCEMMSKYDNEAFPRVIAQLPKPCEPKQ